MSVKHLCVLGSTGSIGKSTLEVVRRFPRGFRVESLCVHSNITEALAQIREFRPKKVCVVDHASALLLRGRCKGVRILEGIEGVAELARDPASDTVMMAITGSAALVPLLKAVDAGKTICLANKEALVMAGPLVMRMAGRGGARILPVDSEQSAIWQCLAGENARALVKIHLTASGGPFLHWERNRLAGISREDALKHPRWKMGRKITVDSATLMNKGLEVIEAMHLFGVGAEKVAVVIHPESIIHSMVEFVDGVVMAQLSVPDMRIPIQYALSYPERGESGFAAPDFFRLKSLNFYRPDFGRFPCLRLAYEAAKSGGSAPCVLNAANEICVNRFIDGKLGFLSIPRCVEAVLQRHRTIARPELDDIMEADSWAREQARIIVEKKK